MEEVIFTGFYEECAFYKVGYVRFHVTGSISEPYTQTRDQADYRSGVL